MAIDQSTIAQFKQHAIQHLNKDAVLFSPESAVLTHLFGKPALWIPRAVSQQPGGRETIYDLPVGQKVLMGIHILNLQIVREFLTRTSNTHYAMSLQTADGQELFQGEGDMNVIDSTIGHGQIEFVGPVAHIAKSRFDIEPHADAKTTKVWIIWSLIRWESSSS